MPGYCVNRNPQPTGEHEVHERRAAPDSEVAGNSPAGQARPASMS